LVISRDGHVRISVDGGVGRLTLNRPEVLNAPSHDMVTTMRSWLARWRIDASVRVVVIDGAGEHGLSAGEDVRALHDDALRGGGRSVDRWRHEYRLAAEIARFPKPVVAFMDGIVMGSGMGLSAHASHRVVEEDSVLAMAEVSLGLIPGHGATLLLARAPGQVGTHLALTADRLDAADAVYCGIADWWVPREKRAALLAALAVADPDDALRRLSAPPPHDSELRAQRPWIDECYSTDRVEDVVQRLDDNGGAEARADAERMATFSPTALKATLRALRAARTDTTIEGCLQREFRVGTRLVVGHDALEGMRARAVDRAKTPVWRPGTLEEVRDADVDAYFAPLGSDDLDVDEVWREA
jgi:enoyl-CoA hydratase